MGWRSTSIVSQEGWLNLDVFGDRRRKLAGNFWGWGVPRTFPRKDDLPDAHKGKPSIRPDGDGSIGAAELTCAANPYITFRNKTPHSLQKLPPPGLSQAHSRFPQGNANSPGSPNSDSAAFAQEHFCMEAPYGPRQSPIKGSILPKA